MLIQIRGIPDRHIKSGKRDHFGPQSYVKVVERYAFYVVHRPFFDGHKGKNIHEDVLFLANRAQIDDFHMPLICRFYVADMALIWLLSPQSRNNASITRHGRCPRMTLVLMSY